MRKYFYHLTAVENVENILANGIRANGEGEIFLFDNKSVESIGLGLNRDGKLVFGKTRNYIADTIALNQLNLKRYAMLEIEADGIDGDLGHDNVAESCSPCQWIARQAAIFPKYVRFFGIYEAQRFGEIVDEWRPLTDAEASHYSIRN